jgi:ABC-type iron transport system FetAB ATPase subunit
MHRTLLELQSGHMDTGCKLPLTPDAVLGHCLTSTITVPASSLQSGAILLDGVDIASYHHKWLRRNMALVSQEPTLYGRSIK